MDREFLAVNANLVTTAGGLHRICAAVGVVHENHVSRPVLSQFRVRGRRGA